jgi:hypothetical protein
MKNESFSPFNQLKDFFLKNTIEKKVYLIKKENLRIKEFLYILYIFKKHPFN